MNKEIANILDKATPYLFGDEVDKLLNYIENLEEIRKEHNIMKQFIYEKGLWERFLNDNRFLEHLRVGDSDE